MITILKYCRKHVLYKPLINDRSNLMLYISGWLPHAVFRWLPLVVGAATILTLLLWGTTSYHGNHAVPLTKRPLAVGVLERSAYVYSLLPEGFTGGCEELFNTPGVSYSPQYLLEASRLAAVRVDWGSGVVPRHGGEGPQLALLLHTLSLSLTHVCVSTVTGGQPPGNHLLALLTAQSDTIIHAFDAGQHPATRPVVNHITGIYGNRLQVHPGNPATSALDFHRTYSSLTCDMVVVNGDQHGEATWGILDSFLQMSVPGKTLVVMEGYPTEQGMAPWRRPVVGGAWELAKHRRLIHEVFRCVFRESLSKHWEHGFTVGVVAGNHSNQH